MTYRITAHHDHTAAADTRTPASRCTGLTALLDPDDIVRPELRNAAILGARHAAQYPCSATPAPTRRRGGPDHEPDSGATTRSAQPLR
ncbi:hypothetical protein ACM26W_12785 [Halomonas sp. HK25]|uniref:hypothetical protein n=1 Tax=Halomonas sp. HK25 TaxID=3394321 RepID=UPI0039FBB8A5